MDSEIFNQTMIGIELSRKLEGRKQEVKKSWNVLTLSPLRMKIKTFWIPINTHILSILPLRGSSVAIMKKYRRLPRSIAT